MEHSRTQYDQSEAVADVCNDDFIETKRKLIKLG